MVLTHLNVTIRFPVVSWQYFIICAVCNFIIYVSSSPGLESKNMILDTSEFHAVMSPELKQLASTFKKYDFEIRIVGGAVRDLLDGKKPHDLDFATVATPTEMKQIFDKEGIRVINEKGEKHGTVTVRINDEINFEITTLRDDISTDGRHAIVQFSKDWEVDAARRDLTINSMYLDFQGTLYDYFNGYEDLKARRVVFVGNPDTRIKEDYLRILRYFRFFGRFAMNPEMHDERMLKAIRDNGAGLAKISGERIWSELSQILVGNFANEIVKKMLDLELAQYMGIDHPNDLDMFFFDAVCHNADKYSFKPITVIAALLNTVDDVLTFHNRVKLSSFERDTALYIVNHKNYKLPTSIKDRLKHFQKSLLLSKVDKALCRAFIIEFLKFQDEEEVLKMFESWTIPLFHIDGNFLKEKGISGKDIGYVLTELRGVWVDNDFVLSNNVLTELLSQFRTGKKDTEKL